MQRPKAKTQAAKAKVLRKEFAKEERVATNARRVLSNAQLKVYKRGFASVRAYSGFA